MIPDGLADGWSNANGVRIHYVAAGEGPPVLFLHGFPEFWYSWRHQLPAVAAAGFRAIAPDLRGYNLSDKPRGIENYRLDRLVGDLAALIGELGNGRACVVGHDWGGVLAWRLAMLRPDLVGRLVILNAPHPAAYIRELRAGGQLLRSWYVFFFQIPALPEYLISLGNFAALRPALAHMCSSEPGSVRFDLEQYRAALARPGALTAALNYYRAAFRSLGRLARGVRTVGAPTLIIWGERDRFLSPRLTAGLEPWVPQLRVERLADASHWVQNEEPELVNRLLLDFLK